MSSSRKQEGFVYVSLLLTAFGVLTGLLNYAFQLLMGGLLSAEDFSAFNAIVAMGLIIGSPFGALQVVATQYVATVAATAGKGAVQQLFRHWSPRLWLAVALGAVVIGAASSPLQEWLQRPDNLSLWLLVAIVATNLLLVGNNTFFQGLQQFVWLGLMPVANVLFRIAGCGLMAGLLGWGLYGALSGVAAAAAVCVAIGTGGIAFTRSDESCQGCALPRFPYRLVPSVIAATFGLTSLTQIDLVLVGRYFEPDVASQYTLAAVLGKAVLYFPTGLVAAVLPAVASSHARQEAGGHQARQAIGATLALAGSAAVACFLLGPWFVRILYGAKYGDAGRLLAFYGPAMVPMGVALVSQSYVVGKGRPLFSWIIAATAVAEIAMLNAWHPSLEAVLATIAMFHTALAVVGGALVMIVANAPADSGDHAEKRS
jgi:O-antigen/teichoic acid export membrane protein